MKPKGVIYQAEILANPDNTTNRSHNSCSGARTEPAAASPLPQLTTLAVTAPAATLAVPPTVTTLTTPASQTVSLTSTTADQTDPITAFQGVPAIFSELTDGSTVGSQQPIEKEDNPRVLPLNSKAFLPP